MMKSLNEYPVGTEALGYINGIKGLCHVKLQSKTFAGHMFLESLCSMDPSFSRGTVIPVENNSLNFTEVEIFTANIDDHSLTEKTDQKNDFDDELRAKIKEVWGSLNSQKIEIVEQPMQLAFDLINENGFVIRLKLSDITRIGQPLKDLFKERRYHCDTQSIVAALGKWCFKIP